MLPIDGADVVALAWIDWTTHVTSGWRCTKCGRVGPCPVRRSARLVLVEARLLGVDDG